MPQTNIANAPAETSRLAASTQSSRSAASTREMLEAVRVQLMNIERKLLEELAARGQRVGPTEILACLKSARHMTAPEILKALPGLAKSSLWLHLNALEREGKVWFQVTHAGGTGRKVTRIWHGEEIAT